MPDPRTTSPGPSYLLDRLLALRRFLERGGWLDAARVACIAFLALLLLGCLLVVAAKLHSPALGAGSSSASVLTAMVLVGLACLGAPITVGGLTLWALPLGALAAWGATIFWASARVARLREEGRPPSPARGALRAARAAVPLALLAGTAASVFRLEGATPVQATPLAAMALAALWGALFGAAGGLAEGGRRGLPERRRRGREPLLATLRRGLQAGGAMTLLVVGTGSVAATLWLAARVVELVRGPGPGEALGALVVLAAFLPNLALGAAALAVGASLELGARVTGGGTPIGPLRHLSLLDGTLPWYGSLLLALPPTACFLSGAAAARRNSEEGHKGPAVLLIAAVTFAGALTAGVALAGVRLTGSGGGLRAGVVADLGRTAALALAWGGVLGGAGWLSGSGEAEAARAPAGPR